MNRTLHAVRVGIRRGWTEFTLSLKSPQDQGFYLFIAIGTLVYLYWNRNDQVEGTSLLQPSVILPSLLGMLLAFGIIVGPAYTLAMEREDGTVLRARATPRGIVGYVSGQIVYQTAQIIPTFVVILVPSFILFDNLAHRGAVGWLTLVWVTVLGLTATLPIGIIIGALVPNTQKVGTWGMLPVMVLAGISGIFFPLSALWGWVQAVAQIFPVYWIGLGMRSAFLPDDAAVLEIGESWRTFETIGVLGAWAIVGLLLTPVVLRRMSRRVSGSQVAAAKDAATQWVR